MFKNKNKNMNNVYRKRIAELRLALNPKCSQRQLAEKLQLFGLDLDKNAILVKGSVPGAKGAILKLKRLTAYYSKTKRFERQQRLGS